MKKGEYLAIVIFLIFISFISVSAIHDTSNNEAEAQSDTNTSDTNTTDTNVTLAEPDKYNVELNLEKTTVQLGDSSLITGTIYKNDEISQEQTNIIFHFVSGNSKNEVYLSIFDGTFSLTPRLQDLPTGKYEISVELIDLKGNRLGFFDNLRELSIDNKLLLETKLDDDQLLPGDKLQILGNVIRNLDRKNVPLGYLTVELDGVEYSTEISNGNIDYNMVLDENILSGDHNLKVRVTDAFGNFGEQELTAYITAKQESLEIELGKKTYNPGDEIDIVAVIYDQANEELVDDTTIKIFDSKNKNVFDEEIISGSSVKYSLDEHALPGEWKISVKSKKLETDKFIEVISVEELEIELVSQILKIRNSGNVNYEKPLEIIFESDSDNGSLELRTDLNPGEETSIELYRYLKNLEYRIIVMNSEQEFQVEIHDDRNVAEKTGDFFGSITGQAIHVSGSKNSNNASYILGSIVILLVVSTLLFKNKSLPSFKIRRKRRSISKVEISKKKGRRIWKKEKNDDIKDFKDRILKDIEKSKIRGDEKEKNKKPFNVQPFFDLPKVHKDEKPKKFVFDRPLSKDKK